MSNNIDSTLSQSMTSVLRDMQESMSGEVDAIRGQTQQVESLLKDAIASLHEAFGSIHEVSDEQVKTMTAMMMDVVGATEDINIFQKAENASEILTGLVDTLLLSSKNNLRALIGMDGLQSDLQTLAELDQKQEVLMVKLCECGKSEQVNVEKMQQLSQQLLDKQYAQTKFTKKTMAHFKKTHQLIDSVASKDMDEVFAAKDKVEKILHHFFQINDLVSSTRVQVNQNNADMRQHLGSAIRALQFEDISSQSLEHTDRHLGRMAGMIAILTEGLENLEQSDITIEAYIAGIAAIHSAMSAYHQALKLEDSNPVSQESMDEGDIDLF